MVRFVLIKDAAFLAGLLSVRMRGRQDSHHTRARLQFLSKRDYRCMQMANFEDLHKRPFLPLATERLLLRPIRDEDAPEIAQLLNNINVSQTTATIPYPYSLDDAISFISSNIQL
jgi:RimJ/RimL family protein N-acetyltransferase